MADDHFHLAPLEEGLLDAGPPTGFPGPAAVSSQSQKASAGFADLERVSLAAARFAGLDGHGPRRFLRHSHGVRGMDPNDHRLAAAYVRYDGRIREGGLDFPPLATLVIVAHSGWRPNDFVALEMLAGLVARHLHQLARR